MTKKELELQFDKKAIEIHSLHKQLDSKRDVIYELKRDLSIALSKISLYQNLTTNLIIDVATKKIDKEIDFNGCGIFFSNLDKNIGNKYDE